DGAPGPFQRPSSRSSSGGMTARALRRMAAACSRHTSVSTARTTTRPIRTTTNTRTVHPLLCHDRLVGCAPFERSSGNLPPPGAGVQGFGCEGFVFAQHSHDSHATGERRPPVPQARTLDPTASSAACPAPPPPPLRPLHGLTQAGLGRLAGFDGSYVGAIERAAVRPARDLVERCDR